MATTKTPTPKEARKTAGHRLVVVHLAGPGIDPWTLKVLCANTREWLDLQVAVIQDPFPGWAGRFYTLAPDIVVLGAQLVDIDANDLDVAIAFKKAEAKETE